jgi:hypothetical protein
LSQCVGAVTRKIDRVTINALQKEPAKWWSTTVVPGAMVHLYVRFGRIFRSKT